MQILGHAVTFIGLLLVFTWIGTSWKMAKEGVWLEQGGWGAVAWLCLYISIVILGFVISACRNWPSIGVSTVVGVAPFLLGTVAVFWTASWKRANVASKPLILASRSASLAIGIAGYCLAATGIALIFLGSILLGCAAVIVLIGARMVAEAVAASRRHSSSSRRDSAQRAYPSPNDIPDA